MLRGGAAQILPRPDTTRARGAAYAFVCEVEWLYPGCAAFDETAGAGVVVTAVRRQPSKGRRDEPKRGRKCAKDDSRCPASALVCLNNCMGELP